MLLGLYGLLCAVSVTFTSALEISHTDLENHPEKTCGNYGSCATRPLINQTFTNGNCMCDESCATYGDCCFDSKYYDSAQQRRAASSFNCVHFTYLGYRYIKQDCPSSWENIEVRRQCEKSASNEIRDPLLMTPVTDVRNNISYGNMFCAKCNSDDFSFENFNFWKLGLNCKNYSDQLAFVADQEFIEKNLNFNESSGYWQIAIKHKYYKCNLVPILDNAALSGTRECIKWVKTCPATWNKKDTRDRCESHSLAVYDNGIAYRNTFCAMCNNILVQHLNCKKMDMVVSRIPSFEEPITSFSVLFDFSKTFTEKCYPCKRDQIYNSLMKRCVDLMGFNSDDVCHCTRIIKLNKTEYSFTSKGVFVRKYKRIYKPSEYRRLNDTIEICSDNLTLADSSADKPYFQIITTIGIGISIICLCAHLFTFAVIKELRNLSGRNLASMCIALLTAYISFILGNKFEGKLCSLNAIATFYFFLATFSWILIISFDIWRSFRIATTELRVNSGNQWRKFFIYSFCGWVLPAKIVLIAVLVDLCPINIVSEQFKPHFGEGDACWFGSGPSLLIFFGLPVFIILVCNLIFFLSSAFMIYSSQSMTRYSATPGTKRDFKLYARLALIMGMTWIIGLVAVFVNLEILWALFVLCNTSIGLFIFLAFTCRKNVLHGLKNLKQDSGLNLPAFSWSLNNSDSSKTTNQSEKHTTNTYY